MGTLANARDNFKESKIGRMFGDVAGLLSVMVNSVDDGEQTVEEAIQTTMKENPAISEELEKIGEIIPMSEKSLGEKAEKINDTSNTFGIDLDSDGYKKIPNKVADIKIEVAEPKVLEKKERAKGGKQRTRVEED